MSSKENYGDKVFCQEIADEMYRLGLVSKTYDFISQQQLKALLVPGGRCLDIGSGSGSIVSWLSEQTELESGEVVAMDRFVHLLKENLTTVPNLKIVQYDLTSEEILTEQYDLVNIRFVLMHLRERADILEKIASWVKPGGWLVVSDILDMTTEQTPHTLYRQAMSTMWEVLIQTIGTDKDWSQTLASRFDSLGFENIKSEIYLPPISKGSPMSEFWYLTWKEIHDRLIEVGELDPKELTKAENDLIQGKVNAFSPGMLTCIGQKPLS